MTEHRGETGNQGGKKDLFQKQKQKEIKPPKKKIPRSSVPDAGQCPNDQKIAKYKETGTPISAKRNIYVFPKPRGKSHVPTAPKFGDAL